MGAKIIHVQYPQIADISTDPNPQLGNHLNANGYTVGFDEQTISYNSGTTTVNWNNGQKASLTFGAGNITTLAFTDPPKAGNFLLKIKQDSLGSRIITNWDSKIKWANGGIPPTLSTAPNAIDILSFYFDGTDYFAVPSLDFQ